MFVNIFVDIISVVASFDLKGSRRDYVPEVQLIYFVQIAINLLNKYEFEQKKDFIIYLSINVYNYQHQDVWFFLHYKRGA
jgi:hypothetical protein